MPLLSAIECGGFLIFASPTIFIQDYDDDSGQNREDDDLGTDNIYTSSGVKIPRKKTTLNELDDDTLFDMQQKQR